EDQSEIDIIQPTVNWNYLTDWFVHNLLSIIFDSCNPSSTSTNEDYTIAYMIIKIMKYMCEDHNAKFQTIFFQEIKIECSYGELNMFELMMCTISKILLLAKWDIVDYEQDENSISYFYEIFFAMIEFAIEMIQGTPTENLNCIWTTPDRLNEKSFFYKFLINAKDIISNNGNDSEIVYNVRLDWINFIAAFVEEKSTPDKIIEWLANIYNPLTIFDSIINTLKKLYLKSIGKGNEIKQKINEIEFDNDKCKFFINKYFSVSEFSQCQEFELANRMYNYVKQLTKYNIKDAKNIIDSINWYTVQQLIDLRTKKVDKNGVEVQQNAEAVMIDPKYCQNYFAVKFFEEITRTVWIQGEEKNSQMVLFTLDPTVLFLSENTKNNFFRSVHRDSRSSKWFEWMEYTNYFFWEINHNKKKLAGNFFFKVLNNINFNYLDSFWFLITVVINIVIFINIESADSHNDYKDIFAIIFPLAMIEAILTFCFWLIWMLSKFSLYFWIEKEKYYISKRKSLDEPLTFYEHLKIIIIHTFWTKKEIVSFIWNFLFSIYGVISSKNWYVFSFQLLILVNINETLQNIAKAIVMRYKQWLTTFMFLIVSIYVFSTIAFFLLSKDFVHEWEGNQENTCGSLLYCFFTHLEFGWRTDGGIGEFISKTSFGENQAYFMGMFFYQFVFFIVIIVVMLAVIGGSVIDTFAELRERSQEDKYDMNNICFICNGNRNEIVKKGENFEEHITKVHHIWTYVDYMIGLKFVDPQETNAINSFVIEKLEDKKISWFPSFKANVEEDEND
ncbi:MAG: ion transporter, partial [Mycoplasma sp.]